MASQEQWIQNGLFSIVSKDGLGGLEREIYIYNIYAHHELFVQYSQENFSFPLRVLLKTSPN